MNRAERIAHDQALWELDRDPVTFYRPANTHGIFSNFSAHSVVLPHPWSLKPVEYPTVEHRFQAMKASVGRNASHTGSVYEDSIRSAHDRIAAAATPGEAKRLGGARGIVPDFDPFWWGERYADRSFFVMLEAVVAKCTQHVEMMWELSMTSGALIYEDSPHDAIWGWRQGDRHDGRNLLGRALMQVRDVVCLAR